MLYTTYMETHNYIEALKIAEPASVDYYIAVFYTELSKCVNMHGKALVTHLTNLSDTLVNAPDTDIRLTLAKEILTDILSDKPCVIEHQMWRKPGAAPYSKVLYEAESYVHTYNHYISGKHYRANTPVFSMSTHKGEWKTYNLQAFDALLHYFEPNELDSITQNIIKAKYTWYPIAKALQDYCYFIKEQHCYNPNCQGVIKAREHRCAECGTHRIICAEDAKNAMLFIEAQPSYMTEDRLKKHIWTNRIVGLLIGALFWALAIIFWR